MSYVLLHIFVNLFILLSCIPEFKVLGDKVEEKIYRKLSSNNLCATLLNATHQIGCTSPRKGNVGVVHYIESDEDFKWLLNYGAHAPYIPLFTAEYFTDPRFKQLVDADKVAGALVAHNVSSNPPSAGFSPEYSCPNDNFGLYKKHGNYSCSTRGNKSVVWNKNGSEMSYRQYDVPVFALTNEHEVNMLVECYNKHNKPHGNKTKQDYPLCGVELQSFMFAAKDTPTCMRKNEAPTFNQVIKLQVLMAEQRLRQVIKPQGLMADQSYERFCDHLGDHNVWGTLFPMEGNLTKDDVILATAKLDSTSFFHDIAPGADNDATGVICLLAAADALGRFKRQGNMSPPDLQKNEKHIMFSFFHGEVWDYIGSSRMVYDMINGNFPCQDKDGCTLSNVNLTNIAYFLELSQVGLPEDATIWAHSDPLSKPNVGSKVARMIEVLKGFGADVKLPIKHSSNGTEQPLPPASFQRFLKENLNIPGLVLTDHEKSFTNKFYNSRFDDLHNVRNLLVSVPLTLLATTVANTLYQLAYNETGKNITANQTMVLELVTCFLHTANCSMFKKVSTNKEVKVLNKLTGHFNRYVGPFEKEGNFLPITKMTKLLLAYFTGLHKNTTDSCTNDKVNYALFKMDGGRLCVNATVYLSPAESPAFLLKDYTSTEYSTWTESRWGTDVGIRMFLIADPTNEIVTLAVGIFLTLISLVVTTFVYTKADQLFTPDDRMLIVNDVQ